MEMDSTNSSLPRIAEVHILLQTQNILEVVTIDLLNGRLGDDLGDDLGATKQHHW